MIQALLRFLCLVVLASNSSLSGLAQTGLMVGTVKPTEAHFLYRPAYFEKHCVCQYGEKISSA